jgi:hypothetical protein
MIAQVSLVSGNRGAGDLPPNLSATKIENAKIAMGHVL